LQEARSSYDQLELVKISAQLNSKQINVIAENWKQSQPVKSSVQSNSKHTKKLKAVTASWNQFKELTTVACCLSVHKKEKADRDHACPVWFW